jgi:hypothetical protein
MPPKHLLCETVVTVIFEANPSASGLSSLINSSYFQHLTKNWRRMGASHIPLNRQAAARCIT